MSSRAVKKRIGVVKRRSVAVVLSIVAVLGAIFASASLGMVLILGAWFTDLPDYRSTDAFNTAQPTYIYASDRTTVLARLQLEYREPVKLKDVSEDLINATLSIEDARFYDHSGVDYFGIMPKVIEEASPFHASFFFSNLGSLGIPPIYHHIYNFGNVSTFLVFGAKEIGYERDDDGNVGKKRYVSCRVVTDERITDGFYMASAFKYLMRILKHPEMLDNPPEQVFEDVE